MNFIINLIRLVMVIVGGGILVVIFILFLIWLVTLLLEKKSEKDIEDEITKYNEFSRDKFK